MKAIVSAIVVLALSVATAHAPEPPEPQILPYWMEVVPAKYNYFPWGQCTFYVASEIFKAGGAIDDRFRGNARHWVETARNIGMTVLDEPKLIEGFITIYVDDRAKYGHNGIVRKYDDEFVWIEESNVFGLGVISTSKIRRDRKDILGYIIHPI